MHTLRCLRIMQMRTIIVFGLFSLSITFLLLLFHTEAQVPHGRLSALSPSDVRYPAAKDSVKDMGRKRKQVLNFLRKVGESQNNPRLFGKGEEKKFVFHQDHDQNAMEDEINSRFLEIPQQSFSNDTRPPLTVPRLMKYCNMPHYQEPGLEGLVPSTYKLISVQVVIRHGDRSPIYKLPSGQATDLSCLTDVSQYSHLPKVISYPHVMANSVNKTPQANSFNRWSLYPSHTSCGEGQLTGRGAIQHIINGIHMNERYLHSHRLFPETDWPRQLLVHTTETSRTYQSALAFIYGFVPDFDISKINLKMSPSVNFCEDNIFGMACQCPGLDSLRTQAEGECKQSKDVKRSNLEYKNVMGYVNKVLGISPSSIPGPTSLMDGLSAHTCHSLAYPCNSNGQCITSKVLEVIWKIIDTKSSCMGNNPAYTKYARAYMHGLLFRIARNFKASSENGTNAKFHLYSGHDTTVSPLIFGLGIMDNVWPGFAHRIVMELYSTSRSQQHFIRVLQNGKVVTNEVIFCRNRTKDHGLCDFEYFMQYLKQRDLRALCGAFQSGLGKDIRYMKF